MLKFVSTHSRAEAAAYNCPIRAVLTISVSTHSRAEAAAKDLKGVTSKVRVSTHSRAEAAAYTIILLIYSFSVSTHSRAEAAAINSELYRRRFSAFQHTAARRRLPKSPAAHPFSPGFNTQPRGGGCAMDSRDQAYGMLVSTHSRAEAAALGLWFSFG